MKPKYHLYILIAIFSIIITACAPDVNFKLPSEQRVAINNRGSQGSWTADLVYTPIDPENMAQELPKSESYVYVAVLTDLNGRDVNYAAIVNSEVDTEANIKETGFEIKSIRYYHVHLENLSEKATPEELNFESLSLKYIKNWCWYSHQVISDFICVIPH